MRRRVLLAASVAGVLASVLVVYQHWRTSRALRGPFRIGFFQSGVDHFPGPDGKPRGATVEILNEAARRCGMQLDWVYSPENADVALPSGHLDLWPILGDIPERRGRLYVSRGYNMIKYELVSRIGARIPADGQWRGFTVARGSQNIEHILSERIFRGARFLTIVAAPPNVPEPEIYGAVCTGRADVAMIASPFAQSKPPVCRGVGLQITDLPESMIMFGIAGSYQRPWAVKAADRLRQQMETMAEDGSLDDIVFRWNFRSPPEVRIVFYMLQAQRSMRQLRYAIALSFGALITLIWLTMRLRVARREAVRAKKAAESASRSKSEFLANMSHEIRTPLNGVLGMTELTLQTALTPEQRDFLNTARGSAEGLLSIINDILDFSKIEAGKMDLEELTVDLRELVELAAGVLVLRAHQKGIELTIDIAAECPSHFMGDPTRIRQVITNLLGNAVKFTEHGEVVVRVTFMMEAERPVLQFSVIDTGIGIPADKQRTIFEAFSQADASTTRKYGGTGLGLAICRRLVDVMRGRFWLESELGRGSVFHFTVPFKEAPQTAEPSNLPELGGARVLVVDDNASCRQVLERMLSEHNINVTSAASGEDAIRALAEAASDPYNLALVDYHMPGMSGLELARRIRSEYGASIPILMMLTSHDWSVASARLSEAGIDAHLIKPVKHTPLLEAIRKVLAAAPGAPGPLAPGAAHKSEDSPGCLRVLLAEDNAVNQRVARILLERSGHSVSVASNGREALDLFNRQPFHLVLMDIQMPEMDGFEAATAIRAAERADGRPRVPIVALTAYAMNEDEVQQYADMDAHLAKPIRTPELNKLLARFADTAVAV
jgi:signal transduction histidine kinase/DNA-binding response OmpR family regulator